jgi:hypothetical protein
MQHSLEEPNMERNYLSAPQVLYGIGLKLDFYYFLCRIHRILVDQNAITDIIVRYSPLPTTAEIPDYTLRATIREVCQFLCCDREPS